MDPLSAIGLISSVITFIDFGYEVVAASEEVRASATGTTKANEQIEFLNLRMKSVAVDLASAKLNTGHMSVDQLRMVEVANKCLELSDDLQRLLDQLKASNPSSKRQVFGTIARNVMNRNKKRDLEARLDQCNQLLQLQLSHTTRLESISRLKEISQTGKCQEKELGSLKQQLVVLTDIVASMRSHSKLQDQARHILNLSDHAVSKVLQNKILESLRFEKMETRSESIEEANTDTFKWILEGTTSDSMTVPTTNLEDPWLRRMSYHLEEDRPLRCEIHSDFTNWLATAAGIYHVSGKPGAGKSTLMKYLTESDRTREYLGSWAAEKKLVFASFFFWRHGTDFQRSMNGLLRSLLYSVLDQYPDLTRVLFPVQWEAACNDPESRIQFRQVDVQKAFSGLMNTPEIYLKHKFAFFIDGLDEFQGREDTLIKTLFEWVHSGSESVKICVSSRELSIFQQRFSKCPKFRLHEATRHDIFLFVYDTLRNNEDVKSLYDPEGVAELGNALVQRAEGVFLWVSLALRHVERGLVLEESIEDLMSSINVLPTEVEELFQVIFDTIKDEPDMARRRKAMRVLNLVVDEAAVNICRNHLYLTALSFMDDYDRNKDFVKDIKDSFTPAEMSTRLSRCQKQLNGGCRGLLSIKSEIRDTGDPFRRETVQLSHRSLIEFFQRSNIRQCIVEQSQGFDRLHFYCQSLIAELKTWSTGSEQVSTQRSAGRQEYFAGRKDINPRDWFEVDVRRLITLFYHIEDSSPSTLCSTLEQLRQLARAETSSTSLVVGSYTCEWVRGRGESRISRIRRYPENEITLLAVEHGLYELFPPRKPDGFFLEIMLHRIEESLVRGWFNKHYVVVKDMAPFDRLLRSLSTCLAHGAPANAPFPIQESHVPVSVWQNLIWHSIVTLTLRASPVPVWLLFFLHGADEDFTLDFEQTCNFSEAGKSGKLVSVTGHWGQDRRQIHSAIYIHGDHGGILNLAKSRNWSVSLMEIIHSWFPLHAEKFQSIRELRKDGARLPKAALQNLRQEFGFDPASWIIQIWDVPEPLFRSWEGFSRILERY